MWLSGKNVETPGLKYSLRHIGHTNCFLTFASIAIATDSLMLLFTQYKSTWLTAISSHCLTTLLAKMSAFNSHT